MGMFDEIHWKGNVYQSKDFDCQMAQYFIENGRLIYENFHYDSVPKEERPYPDAEEGSLKSIVGMIRYVSDGRVDTNFHGVLNLYRHDKDKRWEEWNLKFTDGQLVEETLVPARQSQPSSK